MTITVIDYFLSIMQSCSYPGSCSSSCPILHSPTHSLCISMRGCILQYLKQRIISYRKCIPAPCLVFTYQPFDNHLHYHPLSLYHSFSLLTHFLFPLIHSIILKLRFLHVGCDTTGRCGQDSSLMPVEDKLVSVRWDARHTSACTASVWGLEFVCFLLFFHSRCLSVSLHAHDAGCCQRFCRSMKGNLFCWQFIDWMFLSK